VSGPQGLRWRALWLVIGWLILVTIVYLSVAPVPLSLPPSGGDKLGHLLAYAAAMFWFAQIYEEFYPRLMIAAALVGLGIGLEFVQALTNYRTFDYVDMAADAAGVAIGWIASPPRITNLLARIEAAI
jgi:VanZ family protein